MSFSLLKFSLIFEDFFLFDFIDLVDFLYILFRNVLNVLGKFLEVVLSDFGGFLLLLQVFDSVTPIISDYDF